MRNAAAVLFVSLLVGLENPYESIYRREAMELARYPITNCGIVWVVEQKKLVLADPDDLLSPPPHLVVEFRDIATKKKPWRSLLVYESHRSFSKFAVLEKGEKFCLLYGEANQDDPFPPRSAASFLEPRPFTHYRANGRRW